MGFNLIALISTQNLFRYYGPSCLHNFILEEEGDMALHDFESDLEEDEAKQDEDFLLQSLKLMRSCQPMSTTFYNILPQNIFQ